MLRLFIIIQKRGNRFIDNLIRPGVGVNEAKQLIVHMNSRSTPHSIGHIYKNVSRTILEWLMTILDGLLRNWCEWAPKTNYFFHAKENQAEYYMDYWNFVCNRKDRSFKVASSNKSQLCSSPLCTQSRMKTFSVFLLNCDRRRKGKTRVSWGGIHCLHT